MWKTPIKKLKELNFFLIYKVLADSIITERLSFGKSLFPGLIKLLIPKMLLIQRDLILERNSL